MGAQDAVIVGIVFEKIRRCEGGIVLIGNGKTGDTSMDNCLEQLAERSVISVFIVKKWKKTGKTVEILKDII